MPQPLRLRQRKRVRDGEVREIEDLSPLPTCRIGTDKRGRLQRQTPAGSTDSSSAGEHPALNTGAHEATLEGEDHKVAQVPLGSRPHWELCIGTKLDGPDRPSARERHLLVVNAGRWNDRPKSHAAVQRRAGASSLPAMPPKAI